MSKAKKTLEAMRNNPRDDWRIEHIKTIAADYGLECRNDGGSHHVFSHPSVADNLCVPAHRPIKVIYVRLFVALIDQIIEGENHE